MFGWFRVKSPVAEDDRRWIEGRMAWLVDRLGAGRLGRLSVASDVAELVARGYDGSPAAARALLDRVCRQMEVEPAEIELRFFSDRLPFLERRDGAAASYSASAKTVALERSYLEDPAKVAAAFAHEVAHHVLLGRRWIDPAAADLEPLTDLATVAFGLGIMSANASICEVYRDAGFDGGWRMARVGYLTSPLYGYALAWLAWKRRENAPPWAERLRLDAKDAFRKGLKYLDRNGAQTTAADRLPDYPPGAHRPHRDEPAEEVDPPEDLEWEEAHLGESRHDGCAGRGILLADQGDYAAAIGEYDASLVEDPNDPEVYQLRGEAWRRLGENAKALADAQQAIRLDPEDLEGYRLRGRVRLALDDFEGALADFERVLDEDPRDPELHYGCGLALSGVGQYERAVRRFREAIRHAPVMPEYYVARAEAYRRLGRLEEARADLDEARRRERHES